jgi:hypothetical protein
MKKVLLIGSLLILGAQTVAAKDSERNSDWQVIPVYSHMDIIDDNGNSKSINPACAFDNLINPATGEPVDNSFRFYFKQGESKNLLVYFNGGGACWDDATCVASLAPSEVPGARPSYNPSINEANSPEGAGGIFDDNNKRNPFKDWSKVFIPYCSGDIHIGTGEKLYSDVDGSVTGFTGAPVLVKHHGFDNFIAVREWLKQNLAGDNHHSNNKKNGKIKKLLVTGSSAGGYGATLNFPYLQSTFPEAEAFMLADASQAVVTDGFIQDAFSFDNAWNIEEALAPIFLDTLGAYTFDQFNAQVYSIITTAYPNSRFAQYSTANDLVQVQFLKIMDQLDRGNDEPDTWLLSLPEDGVYFAEWNFRMESSVDFIAANTNNYQYYIGEGTVHTILTDAFATELIPHPFYDERSAGNLRFTKWLKKFVKSKRFPNQSVKYSN